MNKKAEDELIKKLVNSLDELKNALKPLVKEKDQFASLLVVFMDLFIKSLDNENLFYFIASAIITIEESARKYNILDNSHNNQTTH